MTALRPVFFSYVLTFLLSGAFWIWHHESFHGIERVDVGLFGLNLLFLMFVSLLPFSTAMLGRFSLRQPVSLTFYFGNQLALGLTLNAYWWYARRRRLLARPPTDPAVRRFSWRITAAPIACIAALIVAWTRPDQTFSTYAIVTALLLALVRRRLRQPARTVPAPSR